MGGGGVEDWFNTSWLYAICVSYLATNCATIQWL